MTIAIPAVKQLFKKPSLDVDNMANYLDPLITIRHFSIWIPQNSATRDNLYTDLDMGQCIGFTSSSSRYGVSIKT